eukprot:TRINITY_DN32788_c0_g1_i1.p1 TRINITY_DN32788_c0_g1~~TRINITY_DN32788_c0_g1_i1.p1  ORF type:complete len:378 (+),score=116.18 TRINITY_DN32788_c0_g1_i1:102-1235(+)
MDDDDGSLALGIARSYSAGSGSGYVSSPPRGISPPQGMVNGESIADDVVPVGAVSEGDGFLEIPSTRRRVMVTEPGAPNHATSFLKDCELHERAVERLRRTNQCHENLQNRIFLEENTASCLWSERTEMIEQARAKKMLTARGEQAAKDMQAEEHRREVRHRAKEHQLAMEVWAAEEHCKVVSKHTEVDVINEHKQRRATDHAKKMKLSRSAVEQDAAQRDKELRLQAHRLFNVREKRMEATQLAVKELKRQQQDRARRERVLKAEEKRLHEKAKVAFDKRVAAETFARERAAKKEAKTATTAWVKAQPKEASPLRERPRPTVPTIGEDKYKCLMSKRYCEAADIAERMLTLDKSAQPGDRRFIKTHRGWKPVGRSA